MQRAIEILLMFKFAPAPKSVAESAVRTSHVYFLYILTT